MTTDTDITNRALQLIGTRTNIASLAEASNEAIQANLVYNSIRDWCLGVANWNFARRTAKITIVKQIAPPPTVPWSTTSVSPPWLYEYSLPSDLIMVQYITSSSVNSGNTAFLGEPKRFAVALDTIAAVDQQVVLTNEPSAVCVYTAQITDPTKWPWLFERLMVSNLAATLCMVLTGREDTSQRLMTLSQTYLATAIQANLSTGLTFGDTTPEWVQALGIEYPQRRSLGKSNFSAPASRSRGQSDDN